MNDELGILADEIKGHFESIMGKDVQTGGTAEGQHELIVLCDPRSAEMWDEFEEIEEDVIGLLHAMTGEEPHMIPSYADDSHSIYTKQFVVDIEPSEPMDNQIAIIVRLPEDDEEEDNEL